MLIFLSHVDMIFSKFYGLLKLPIFVTANTTYQYKATTENMRIQRFDRESFEAMGSSSDNCLNKGLRGLEGSDKRLRSSFPAFFISDKSSNIWSFDSLVGELTRCSPGLLSESKLDICSTTDTNTKNLDIGLFQIHSHEQL